LKCFVTGGVGFIGSHLVDRLVADGHQVVVYDNLSTGHAMNLIKNSSTLWTHIMGNIADYKRMVEYMQGCDIVFHLAAHADVRSGPDKPYLDLRENTVGTFQVLEAMRAADVMRIVFASTGSVYGEATVRPTPEDAPFPVQTSLYGASKLACEGLIEAFSNAYGIQAYIFRLVGVLGERYSHGHVLDFYNLLQEFPHSLPVQGNGYQCKSYVYVKDVVEAMLTAIEKADEDVHIFNVGTDEYCTVRESIEWITEYLHVSPEVFCDDNKRGWIGDNPFVYLDCSRLRALGWKPTLTIRESVIRTVDYLAGVKA
jgi:UDP-glucose 4-epimerase